MNWDIIDSGKMSPQSIMDKDEKLLHQLHLAQNPILHLYEWESDCLTYGYFTDPSKYLDLDSLFKHGIQMARRPTGGGIIFHLSDFAFSIFIPATNPHFSLNTLENYAFINSLVVKAINPLLDQSLKPQLFVQAESCKEQTCHAFCMAKPTQYDIIVNGQKIGGAAQRRTKQGFLHQGSLSIALPSLAILRAVLKQETIILEAMQRNTFSLLGPDWSVPELKSMRQKIKQALLYLVIPNLS